MVQTTQIQGRLNKKGQIVQGSLIGGVLLLVIAAVVAVVGLNLLDGLGQDFVTNTNTVNTSIGCNATVTNDCGAAFNASTDGRTGISNITSKFGLIGTIIVSVFLLTLIVGITLIFRGKR